jgi:DNA-directed RNA polymerase subunit alpha
MIIDKIKAKFSRKQNPALDKPITELDLSLRTYNVLGRAGIATVGDLVGLSWNDVSRIRRSTRRTCEEVERALKGIGLELKEK